MAPDKLSLSLSLSLSLYPPRLLPPPPPLWARAIIWIGFKDVLREVLGSSLLLHVLLIAMKIPDLGLKV
jgi:hypothetical protein